MTERSRADPPADRSRSGAVPDRARSDAAGTAPVHVALYGSLMRGLEGHAAVGLDETALRYEGACVIPGALYDLGPYPGLRLTEPGRRLFEPVQRPAEPGPRLAAGGVRAELHRILDAAALPRLDAFEDFDPDRPDDSLYLRAPIRLIEPRDALAWVYVYNREPPPSARIAGGDWRHHLAHRDRASRSDGGRRA